MTIWDGVEVSVKCKMFQDLNFLKCSGVGDLGKRSFAMYTSSKDKKKHDATIVKKSADVDQSFLSANKSIPICPKPFT